MNPNPFPGRLRLALSLCVLSQAVPSAAEVPPAWRERLHEVTHHESRDGRTRVELSGTFDLECYYIDQRPPGLLIAGGEFLLQPRLSVLLDAALGSGVSAFAQVRADRGFDAGFKPDGDLRLDEFVVRFAPTVNPQLNFQLGRFATVVGTWTARHDSWTNTFINAPLAYEEVLAISDRAAPGSRAAFTAIQTDPANKETWIPVIWGPVYATGVAVSGRGERFEYAFETKNASLSARPEAWNENRDGWRAPTFSGRMGLRPNATWRFGASASHGAYLQAEATPSLPPATGRRDFQQTVAGIDVAYAWRHLQLWSEAFATRFEVPRVGNARAFSYYLEGRYKIRPKHFLGLRWNQQLFGRVTDGIGNRVAWDRDAWRIDLVWGNRPSRYLQGKLQYSYSHQKGPFQQGEQMMAAQVTTRF